MSTLQTDITAALDILCETHINLPTTGQQNLSSGQRWILKLASAVAFLCAEATDHGDSTAAAIEQCESTGSNYPHIIYTIRLATSGGGVSNDTVSYMEMFAVAVQQFVNERPRSRGHWKSFSRKDHPSEIELFMMSSLMSIMAGYHYIEILRTLRTEYTAFSESWIAMRSADPEGTSVFAEFMDCIRDTLDNIMRCDEEARGDISDATNEAMLIRLIVQLNFWCTTVMGHEKLDTLQNAWVKALYAGYTSVPRRGWPAGPRDVGCNDQYPFMPDSSQPQSPVVRLARSLS